MTRSMPASFDSGGVIPVAEPGDGASKDAP
jgi:hypothetical protein